LATSGASSAHDMLARINPCSAKHRKHKSSLKIHGRVGSSPIIRPKVKAPFFDGVFALCLKL
jgi:hypothetical protein